jgi:hypothetical protein
MGNLFLCCLIFYCHLYVFLKKLVLYEDRIQINYPFAKFRDKTVLLNDIDTAESKGEYIEFYIKLKSGSKIKLSTILMRQYDEFEVQLSRVLRRLNNSEN